MLATVSLSFSPSPCALLFSPAGPSFLFFSFEDCSLRHLLLIFIPALLFYFNSPLAHSPLYYRPALFRASESLQCATLRQTKDSGGRFLPPDSEGKARVLPEQGACLACIFSFIFCPPGVCERLTTSDLRRECLTIATEGRSVVEVRQHATASYTGGRRRHKLRPCGIRFSPPVLLCYLLPCMCVTS